MVDLALFTIKDLRAAAAFIRVFGADVDGSHVYRCENFRALSAFERVRGLDMLLQGGLSCESSSAYFALDVMGSREMSLVLCFVVEYRWAIVASNLVNKDLMIFVFSLGLKYPGTLITMDPVFCQDMLLSQSFCLELLLPDVSMVNSKVVRNFPNQMGQLGILLYTWSTSDYAQRN